MDLALPLDRNALAAAGERFGVLRLRVFGSVTTENFDVDSSDIDFLVDFPPDHPDLFGAYLGLKTELENIVGRKVDLVMADAVKNPYFKASAFRQSVDVYAA